MCKKIKKSSVDGIYFLGNSSTDVTGSQYLVKWCGKNILLECGIVQCANYLDNYRANNEKFKFNAEDVDYLFIGHSHIDHLGNVPRVVKEGFKGKIIATSNTAAIINPLLLNCAFLLGDEARVLTKRYKREYTPAYIEDDVYRMLDFVYEYDEYNKIYKLDDNVSFQFLHNSHCVGAAQIQLILTGNDGSVKKILYTSDIGGLKANNHYVENTEIMSSYNDYVIMESTYGERSRINEKTREFDLEKMKTAILTTLERKGTIIFPAFSFSRSQELMTVMYLMFGNDKEFKYNIFVDSLLTCDISDVYDDVLDGEDLKLWKKVRNWKNIKFIKEKTDSQCIVKDHTPKIVISSSGFCTNGRVTSYLGEYLSDINSTVMFSGYVGNSNDYLAYRIKNGRPNEQIKIGKVKVDNRADCYSLGSFSSHANRNDLITFGSKQKCSKLILVHGSEQAKHDLKEDLVEAISKENNTHKVIISEKDMVIKL